MNDTIKYILAGWLRLVLAFMAGKVPALCGADDKLIQMTAEVLALGVIMGWSALIKLKKDKQKRSLADELAEANRKLLALKSGVTLCENN
jgi:hypothetical protein